MNTSSTPRFLLTIGLALGFMHMGSPAEAGKGQKLRGSYTQAFARGDTVRIADKLPPEMSHFKAGKKVVIVGSYVDQFSNLMMEPASKHTARNYTVEFRNGNQSSWYPEKVLTLVKRAKR